MSEPKADQITCSFCGHAYGDENDDTIILVGTMGANICENCVARSVRTILDAKQRKQDEQQTSKVSE